MELQSHAMKDRSFLEESEGNDFGLVVDGDKGPVTLFVNKTLLSCFSPVFKELCCNESYREAKDGRAVLVGKTEQDVVTLLECLIPHRIDSVEGLRKEITEGNLEVLVNFCEEYSIASLFQDCLRFIDLSIQKMTGPSEKLLRFLSILGTAASFHTLCFRVVEKLITRAVNLPLETIEKYDQILSSDIKGALYAAYAKKYSPRSAEMNHSARFSSNRNLVLPVNGHFVNLKASLPCFGQCESCPSNSSRAYVWKCRGCRSHVCRNCATYSACSANVQGRRSCRDCSAHICYCPINNAGFLYRSNSLS